ncbi:hypothetical protein ABTX77_42220 [Streptomyces sp. NPDC097704]|uniref:hypothetical protein n=1 Tax=Streptomyces sp. NPDC097704 TaxID=3157101 RepID=UPI0033169A63
MGKLVSGRRTDPEEARQLMLRNGCNPKVSFTSSKTPWTSTCMRCDREIAPTYDSISTKAKRDGDAPRGCGPCADKIRAEKYRLDEDELAKTVAAANIEPLEPYEKNSKPWSCRCLNAGCPRDGKPIKVLVKVIRAGGMACRYCSQKEIHADDALKMMMDLGKVKPKVPYPGVDKQWLGECLRCHEAVTPRLHDVRNGQGGCIHCAPNTPLTPEQAWERALSYRVLPDDPHAFENTNTPWAGTCMECEANVNPRLGNLYRGQGACNSTRCKITGFKDDMPALVYLLHRSEPRLAKIGICEDGPYNRRLEGHTRNGWEVAHTLTFQVGLHARLLESAIKRLWFKERAWADGPARGEARFDGYTETVLLDDPGRSQPWTKLTLFSLWTDVRGQAERLGFTMDERRAAAQVEGADVPA